MLLLLFIDDKTLKLGLPAIGIIIAIGVAVGLLAHVLDPKVPTPKPENLLTPSIFDDVGDWPPASGTLISRLLAILSLTLFIFGPVGLVLGLMALWGNRRNRGWPLVVNWLGIVLSSLMTALMWVAVALDSKG